MIIPINESSVEIIIRNPISNVNMVIQSDFSSDNHSQLSKSGNLKFLNSLINKKSIKTVDIDFNNFNNQAHKLNIPITNTQEKFFHKINKSNSNRTSFIGTVGDTNPKSKSTQNVLRPVFEAIIAENFVFQQLLSLITEKDFYFENLLDTSQVEDFINTLDTTPVYYTFNCGIIYIPSKSKFK